MTDIERQILLNQIVILETLGLIAPSAARDTRELLKQRYRESAQLVRQHSNPPQRG